MAGRAREYTELAAKWIHFTARGHRNVSARHRTTFEVTREDSLTPRGDCIIGVSSAMAAASLPQWLKEGLRRPDSIVVVILCAEGICDSVTGSGSPRLILSDSTRMIFRKSTYIEPATVMIKASKAAKDLDRRLVEALRRGAKLNIYMTVIRLQG